MKVIRSLPDSPPFPYPVLTIGNFDGQHIGHQALLSSVVQKAQHHQGTSLVLTFNPHPAKILVPGVSLQFLSTRSEQLEFFERMGIEVLVMLEFNRQLANLTPQEFTSQVFHDGLGVRDVFVGENFVFGKGRSGNVQELERLGSQLNFDVHPVAPVCMDDEIVSSTRIRKLLQTGAVKEAARCLGRPYRLTEQVVHGEHRGARLGWPTANLRIPSNRVMPADGIYATMAFVQGEWLPSVSYIGSRPTFENGERILEVHVFDENRSLYGESLKVNFIDFIRGDQHFADERALMHQIERDSKKAREILQSSVDMIHQADDRLSLKPTSCQS